APTLERVEHKLAFVIARAAGKAQEIVNVALYLAPQLRVARQERHILGDEAQEQPPPAQADEGALLGCTVGRVVNGFVHQVGFSHCLCVTFGGGAPSGAPGVCRTRFQVFLRSPLQVWPALAPATAPEGSSCSCVTPSGGPAPPVDAQWKIVCRLQRCLTGPYLA